MKLFFEANRLVLTRNGEFAGKGFCNNGLFILDVVCEKMNASAGTSSTYIVESLDLWHERLGHVNIASIKTLKQQLDSESV